MKRVRKYLLLSLFALSLVFATLAIYQMCIKDKDGNSTLVEDIHWGKNVEAVARSSGKLVFAYMKGETFPKDVLEELEKNYVVAEIDFDLWPADNVIFDTLISNKKRTPMLFGIFTPRLSPFFLSSERTFEIDGVKLGLAALLSRTAHSFNLNKKFVYETAAKFRKSELEKNDVITVRLKEFARGENHSGEIERIAALLISSGDVYPSAVLSETMRLALRISARIPSGNLNAALKKAAGKLKEKLSQKDRQISERLVIARALAEYCGNMRDPDCQKELFEFAKEVAVMQREDGFFYGENKFPLVRTNALAVNFFTKLAEFFGREDYLKSAIKAANCLEQTLYKTRELPAVADFGGVSQASSFEYAFLTKAFADLYELSGNKKYLNIAKFSLDEWRRNYMTKEGVWTVNSRNSQFGLFQSYVVTDDSEFPTYIGEGMQAVHKIERLDSSFDITPYMNMIRFVKSLRQSESITRGSRSSIKMIRYE